MARITAATRSSPTAVITKEPLYSSNSNNDFNQDGTSLISSPNTPPRKLWERSYRKFLGSSPRKKACESNNTTALVRNNKIPGLLRRRVKSSNELDETMRNGSKTNVSNNNNSLLANTTAFKRSTQSHMDMQQLLQHASALPPLVKSTSVPTIYNVSRSAPSAISNMIVSCDADPLSPSSDGRPICSINAPSYHVSPEKKKAFTMFHNSAEYSIDANSAYLDHDNDDDDDALWIEHQRLSAAAAAIMQPKQHYYNNSSSTTSSGNNSPTLETVHESMGKRMLKPLQGADTWQQGRRYQIAPAALVACPITVLNSLTGQRQAVVQQDNYNPFTTILLGECQLCYADNDNNNNNNKISSAANRPSIGWSQCTLMLRQNYLLEYGSSINSGLTIPRGYAHLEHATCKRFANDVLELHFYSSPCAKADPRVLLIHVANDACDTWMDCINRAAKLRISDLYEFGNDCNCLLGRGPYASVYKAKKKYNSTNDDFNCAIKVFDKAEFWRRVAKGQERADTIVREASVQATLTAKRTGMHSSLKIYNFFETSENVVLELELLNSTDLFKYITSKGSLSEEEAARIMYDIIKCLDAMHRLGLVHRDIKPANILMCANNNDNASNNAPLVKVSDYGMAAFMGIDGTIHGRCGTPGYVAPEILNKAAYGNKADVFSAGVTLYVMLCGYEPFYGETDDELIQANKVADFDFVDWNVSNEAKDLIRRMMCRDPTYRLSVTQVLNHKWMKKYNTGPELLQSSDSSLLESGMTSRTVFEGSASVSDQNGCVIS